MAGRPREEVEEDSMEGIIVVTYRCNAKCYMCNTWQYPTDPAQEITPADVERIPDGLKFCNITGGEPFLREDLEEIVAIATRKAERVVISTNGYFTDRVIALAKKHPQIGVRVSLEGLPAANDELRGLPDGFDHGLRTILNLKHMGLKDIGFGITVSDRNAKDMLELYMLACSMDLEFATAVTHNTYYFHKFDNEFHDPDMIAGEFEKLIAELFRSRKPKSWFRAYLNHFLINRVYGGERPLPCECGDDVFMLDPFGDIRPCNGMDVTMGNIREQSFDEIWHGPKAAEVRKAVSECTMNCWMVGSAAPAMKKAIPTVLKWILRNRGPYLRGAPLPCPCIESAKAKRAERQA
jgi:Fe-coproporphyrin III synthase